jgi:hypothetical protein
VRSEDVVVMMLAISIILGAVVVFIMTVWQRGRLRELAYKERLAMIERGIAPPPEVDPARFEQAMGQRPWDAEVASRAARYRRMGVIVIGLGVGLFMLIGFAAEQPETAFGIGGALAALGIALYVNSHLEMRNIPPVPRTSNLEPRTSNVEPRT